MFSLAILLLSATSIIATPISAKVSIIDDSSVEISWYTLQTEISTVHFSDSSKAVTTKEIIEDGEEIIGAPTAEGTRFFHKVTLPDLSSRKTYVYICGSADFGWSGIHSFTLPSLLPTIAVLGNIQNTPTSESALAEIAEHNLADRLDAMVVFSEPSTPSSLFGILQSNIPTLVVPEKPSDAYYSVQLHKAYLIFLNTNQMDGAQQSWLIEELETAKDFGWILVFGQNSGDFKDTLDAYDVNIIVTAGKDTYKRIGYDGIPDEYYKTLTVEQIPLGAASENTEVTRSPDEVSTKAPGYGFINFVDSAHFKFIQYDSSRHVEVDNVIVHKRTKTLDGVAEYDDMVAALYLSGLLFTTLIFAILVKYLGGFASDSRLKEVHTAEEEILSE